MGTTTKTIAYVLSVPAASLQPGLKPHTPATAADVLVHMLQTAQTLGLFDVELTGSHVDAEAGAIRFRVADDATAIRFATWLIGDAAGATLHSGFGVNKRLVATN